MRDPFTFRPSTLSHDELASQRSRAVYQRDGSLIAAAVGLSLAAHIAVIWIATTGLLSSSDNASMRLTGDPDGEESGASIELVSVTDFDNRFITFKGGFDATDLEAAALAAKSVPPRAQTQPQSAALPQPRTETKEPGDVEEALVTPPKAPVAQPSVFAKMTDAEIAKFVDNMKSDFDQSVTMMSKAGTARRGEASPFVREILRILKQAMPRPFGTKGRVVIQLIVSPTGEVEALRVAQSSGMPELDRMVLQSIRSAHLTPPTKDTKESDRFFNVTYIFE